MAGFLIVKCLISYLTPLRSQCSPGVDPFIIKKILIMFLDKEHNGFSLCMSREELVTNLSEGKGYVRYSHRVFHKKLSISKA